MESDAPVGPHACSRPRVAPMAHHEDLVTKIYRHLDGRGDGTIDRSSAPIDGDASAINAPNDPQNNARQPNTAAAAPAGAPPSLGDGEQKETSQLDHPS